MTEVARIDARTLVLLGAALEAMDTDPLTAFGRVFARIKGGNHPTLTEALTTLLTDLGAPVPAVTEPCGFCPGELGRDPCVHLLVGDGWVRMGRHAWEKLVEELARLRGESALREDE